MENASCFSIFSVPFLKFPTPLLPSHQFENIMNYGYLQIPNKVTKYFAFSQ